MQDGAPSLRDLRSGADVDYVSTSALHHSRQQGGTKVDNRAVGEVHEHIHTVKSCPQVHAEAFELRMVIEIHLDALRHTTIIAYPPYRLPRIIRI